MRRFALALAALALAALALAASAAATTETFQYTGAAQTWTVPAGVSEATFDLYGASGSGSPNSILAAPGLGGQATATIAVTPGDSIQVTVGGRGVFDSAGGFNGGGASLTAHAGGGASDIRISGTALTNRVLVAGGGGAAGLLASGSNSAAGGAGGGESGGPGVLGAPRFGRPAPVVGGGGTQLIGGTAGSPATPGQFGVGGGGGNQGGGGGGGWYGGGGGNNAGGGGGSGRGPAGTVFQPGVRSGNGLVTVTYNQAPTANGGADQTVGSQASVALDGGGSSDPDGDTLDYEWTQSSGPSVTLSGADTATASFTAPLGPATLEFQLKVCDAEPLCDTDTVLVAVAPPNDAPTTAADSYATDEDTPLNVAAPGLLDNDTDPEGDGLTAALVSGPEHGRLTLNEDGSFGYTPDPDYNGSDSFTYTASDGQLDSDPASVTIEVRAVDDTPVSSDDEYATDEDTPLSLEVLANDTDRDGDTLTATVVSGPEHGSLTLNGDGSLSYTPDPDYNGSDSFTYRAGDGQLDSDPASVTIEIRAVNDAPDADGDAYATDEDRPLTIDAPGVLGNDADIEGDGLAAALVSGPEHGRLELNDDGSFSYTPDPGYNGSDSFTYRANDGKLDSEPVTVTIDVRPVDDPAPPAGAASTAPAGAATPAGPAAPRKRALGQLRLHPRCVQRSRSGRVPIRMSLRMAQPGPLQIRIDRAVGAGALRGCPSPNPERRFTGRFHKVATLDLPATRPAAAAAMVARRFTLRPRLAPGLYRITVRAQLDHNRLSAPVRRYLRVLG